MKIPPPQGGEIMAKRPVQIEIENGKKYPQVADII
jgi:hypothetical protein